MRKLRESLLEIQDLHVHYTTEGKIVKAVNGVSLHLDRGETLGIVGETGAGKSTTALSIMRLIQTPPGNYANGKILFKGENLLALKETDMKKIRGNEISMIFQDPMTSLNPVYTVGDQIAEVIWTHEKVTKEKARKKAGSILELVGIPAERGAEYPHEFSGGMRQRVVIAIALACNPELLIADEPTTALDVTIQAQVLELMKKLKEELNTAMILITHDLGVVAEVCDNVAIMYAGEIVEYGTVEDIFNEPSHPYTKGLFDSIPKLDVRSKRLKPIKGLMPDPTDLPTGCIFHPRCPFSIERCQKEAPLAYKKGDIHHVACHLFDEYPIKGGEVSEEGAAKV